MIYHRGSKHDILVGQTEGSILGFYSCPKFCLILSATGTPKDNLANFLARVLSPLAVIKFSRDALRWLAWLI